MNKFFVVFSLLSSATLFGEFRQQTDEERLALQDARRQQIADSQGKGDTKKGKKDAAVSAAEAREAAIQARAAEIRAAEERKKAERDLKKISDNADRKARKEIENRERFQEQVKNAASVAGLRGCPANTVWISPTAVGTRSYQAYSKVTVYNRSGTTIDIRDEFKGEYAVRNLCPGGVLTLFKRLGPIDPDYIYFWYVATRHDPGEVLTYQSPQISLTRGYSQPQIRDWYVGKLE